jgi:hypothetical protein
MTAPGAGGPFFTGDLLNGTKVYGLAAIEHGTRRIRILGATEHAVQAWAVQQARNLLMDLEDAGSRVTFVPHARTPASLPRSTPFSGPGLPGSSGPRSRRRG